MTTTPFNITLPLVEKLIAQQFPEFAHLPIQPVKMQGHDNRTFRLGEQMSIRMPTAKSYALKVPKEQEWLPKLAPHLTTPIPTPLRLGHPDADYPFNFSIYKWLDGESANSIKIKAEDLTTVAASLAQFLQELHKITTEHGPVPGLHNWYRGEHVSAYDAQARTQIAALSNIINKDQAMSLWERSIATKWHQLPVWIHGDFASGNILIKDGSLAGIIDFGGMGIGDPACDLVIAWTFLHGSAREIFKQTLNLDPDTWARARGWALWKATFELTTTRGHSPYNDLHHKKIISTILAEDEAEN